MFFLIIYLLNKRAQYRPWEGDEVARAAVVEVPIWCIGIE